MPVEKDLLEILCCPETKVELEQLAQKHVDAMNEKIAKNECKYRDGKLIDKPIEEALITVDKKTIYRIDEEIPIMLIEMSIPAEQFGEF